jgi:tetratricopeptide (TPR) repeat protein
LTDHADVLPQRLAKAVKDGVGFDKALMALRRYSLIQVTDDAFTIHRLVQAVMRAHLPDNASWINAAIAIINKGFPQESHDVRFWQDCARLRPHAEVALAAAQDVTADVNNTGRLLSCLVVYLKSRAEYINIQAYAEQALRVYEAALGPNHPMVAVAVGNLGSVLRDQGDLIGARALFERSLRIREAALGPDHPLVVIAVNNLGNVLRDQGDLIEARALFERSLRIREAALGPNHLMVAVAVGNLGKVLRDQRDLIGARDLLERALRICEAARGPNHPMAAVSAANLAHVLWDQGDLIGARTLLKRALQIDEAALGPDHPDTARVRSTLADLDRGNGNIPPASLPPAAES